MADLFLPLAIQESILSKLPAKCLFRFQSVCRSWKSIINSPLFTPTRSDSNSDSFFMCWDHGAHFTAFCLTKIENQYLKPAVDFIFVAKFSGVSPLCSCNGLVLLIGLSCPHCMYLLNPVTGIYIEVLLPHDLGFRKTFYGLCFDESSGDYKIVVISGDIYLVYYCKGGTWSKKKQFLHGQIYSSRGVYVDGSLYFALSERNILRFNSKDDTFSYFPKPEDLESDDGFFLQNLGGYLCLYTVPSLKCCCIWKLNGGIWIKFAIIDDLWRLGFFGWIDAVPVCLMNENDILIEVVRRQLFVYRRDSKIFEFVADLFGGSSGNLIPCYGSLSFPSLSRTFERKSSWLC